MALYLSVEYFHPSLNLVYAEAFSYIESQQDYVPILINSYGGYTDCLSTLLDCIKGSTKPVMTIATGVDMSCGADLFVSGTKGLRIIGPNTTSLIHQVSGMSWGKYNDIKAEAQEIDRLNKKILYDLFDQAGDHPEGYTEQMIKDNFNADLYLTPEKMIENGWADKIMSVNQVLLNMDNIFQDYKQLLDKVELDEELTESTPSVFPPVSE